MKLENVVTRMGIPLERPFHDALSDTFYTADLCRLLDLHPNVIYTEEYQSEVPNDFREIIRPKHEGEDPSFSPKPYYQVFQGKHGFLPNMSIVDLLFNMGPEGLLVLRDSIVASKQP